MRGFIYCYTNKINGMKYVGQTIKTLAARAGTNGSSYHYKFGNAIKVYGWENFIPEILEEIHADSKELLRQLLNEREAYWIAELDTYLNGYNITRGGNAAEGWTDEMKQKLAATERGHIVSEETKQKISKANTGRKNTEEQKQHISEGAKRGLQKFKEEQPEKYAAMRAAQRQKLLGRKFTDEWRQKLKEHSNAKSVICIELNKKYESMFAACRAFNPNCKNGGPICQAIKQNSTAYGYHWRLEE